MDKLRRALSGNEDEEQGIVSQISDASSLSWSTRIKGFIICFLIGFVFSILGTVCIFFGNYVAFAILYTLGSITSIASTGFLVGPIKQLKNMFAPTRAIATVVMLVSLVLTLLAAFLWKSGGLALLFVIIQFIAMTWYSLSYIPYARDAIMKCFQGCIG